MEVVHKIVEDPELLINTVPGRPKVALNRGAAGAGGTRRAGAQSSFADDEGLCC